MFGYPIFDVLVTTYIISVLLCVAELVRSTYDSGDTYAELIFGAMFCCLPLFNTALWVVTYYYHAAPYITEFLNKKVFK